MSCESHRLTSENSCKISGKLIFLPVLTWNVHQPTALCPFQKMSKGISFFTSKYMKSNVNFALGRKNVRISEQIMSAGKYRCKQSLKYICSRAIGVIALRDRISTKWYSLVFKPRFYWNNRVRLKFNSRSESVKLLLQKKVHACLFIKSYQRTLKSTHSLQQTLASCS